MIEPVFISLRLDGMSCAGCVGRVERGLLALDGVSEVAVNLATETATLRAEGDAQVVTVVTALDALGYRARQTQVTLAVDCMSCASCIGRVEAALRAEHGVLSASVNMAT